LKRIWRPGWYLTSILIIMTILNTFSYALAIPVETMKFPLTIKKEKIRKNLEVIKKIEIKVKSEYEKFTEGEYSDIKEIIWDNAIKTQIDPNYLLGICLIETGKTLNPNIIGIETDYGRARGIMQLMPELIQLYHIKNPFDPRESIKVGTTHLKYLIDYYKDKKIYDENEKLIDTKYVAAIAYNWGQDGIDQMLKKYNCIIIKNIPYESRRYYKIIRAYCEGDEKTFNKLMN